MTASVMHSDRVPDEGREYRGSAGPGLYNGLVSAFVHFIDSLQQLRRSEGAFL
jgi:hypothetical protein